MATLREELIPAAFEGVPAEVHVGGLTAETADFYGIVDVYTPIVFAFVLGLSFIILMMVFRSIVIPIKAIIMNLLSVGATYGLLVLVFQKGIGADLLGFDRAEVIDAWLPLFLFTILFGLSMDYHVFLLSRIRERYDETQNNTEAVAYGLRSTAGIITGAALIMVVVFGAFATGETIVNQLMGFGLAIAVLLDATLVRSVLVPASMEVLGKGNWYLPSWLSWLPDLRVEAVEDSPLSATWGVRLRAMRIPTDYLAGYERARSVDRELADKLHRSHNHRRPRSRCDGRGALGPWPEGYGPAHPGGHEPG